MDMDRYTLPSGAEVDIDLFVEAMLAEDEYPSHFFDTKTGCIVHVPSPDNLKHWVDDIGTTDRYFLIERLTDEDRDTVSFDFLDNIVYDMMTPKELHGARKALEKGGWRAMAEFLEESAYEWGALWEQFIYDAAFTRADDFLVNNPRVGATTTFEGFDDCPACELLRDMENIESKQSKTAITTEEAMQNVVRHLKEHSTSDTPVAKLATRKKSPTKKHKGVKKNIG